jgi:hypothetical protein
MGNATALRSVESADGFFFIEYISSERRPNFSHHRDRAVAFLNPPHYTTQARDSPSMQAQPQGLQVKASPLPPHYQTSFQVEPEPKSVMIPLRECQEFLNFLKIVNYLTTAT